MKQQSRGWADAEARLGSALFGFALGVAISPFWNQPPPPGQIAGYASTTLHLDARAPFRFIIALALLTIALPLLLTPLQRRLAAGRPWARNGVFIAGIVSLWIALVERSLWMTAVPFAAALVVCTAMRNVDLHFTRRDVVLLPPALAIFIVLLDLAPSISPANVAIIAAAAVLAARMVILRPATRVPRPVITWIIFPLAAYAFSLSLSPMHAEGKPRASFFEEQHGLVPVEQMLHGKKPWRDFVPAHGLIEDGLLDYLALAPRRNPTVGDALRVRSLFSNLLSVALYALGAAATGSAEAGFCAYLLAVMYGSSIMSFRIVPALFALACTIAAVRQRKPRWFAAAGFLLVIAGLSGLDFAFYSAVALAVAIIRFDAGRMRALREAAAGIAAGTVPLFVILLVTGLAGDFLHTTFVEIPAMAPAYAMDVFLTPRVIDKTVVGYILWPILAIVAGVLLAGPRRRSTEPIALLAVWAVAAGISYAERHHMYFSYVAGPFVAAAVYLMFRLRNRWAPVLLAIVIAIGGPAATFDTIGILRRAHGPLEPLAEIVDPPRARDVLWLPYYARVVAQSKHFIDRLPPGDTFFDFTNRGILYFLFDRDCPIRQTEVARYEPEARQREIIAAIERNPHVVAALVPPPQADTTGVDSVPNPVRAPLVWKYLQTHFHPEFQEGVVVFWRRNGPRTSRPAAGAPKVPGGSIASMTTLDAPSKSRAALAARFAAFVAEKHPFALKPALAAFERGEDVPSALRDALRTTIVIPETTPGVAAGERLEQAMSEVVDDIQGFFRREEIAASLTPDERREILRGMLLTRATDNRLKQFFTGGEVRYGNASFQGKGFRSLGQEAIYAAPLRLRRGPQFRAADGTWAGDVISPMIRDLGAVLAMHNDPETVRLVLNAQMGKAGPPMDGRDLHVGDWSWGVLPAMAPLGAPALTISGIAMAFSLRREERVAVSFIGEGATSLGEWHEAINAAAARRLPAIFCVQNNQTALSTPVRDNSAVRVFADKAAGYGIPSITIDGTDPDAIAAAFAWAAERARGGDGSTLIELVAMRMCGHAHHDDMLYLGRDPQPAWEYPPLSESGYADRKAYDYWCQKDPIATYTARLEAEEIVAPGEVEGWKREIEALVEAEARAIIDARWPDPAIAGTNVLADEPRRVHVEVLDEEWRQRASRNASLPPVEEAPPFDPKGRTFLDAVMLGVGDALRSDPRTFVYGEDVGGAYGNAFLLLKPLLKEFGDRIINSVLAEGSVLGVSVGAALAGLRPIAEIQFNDFVATGFNELVNNAAKLRYRWGASVPMVVRMAWGGLRHAGPYHSQNTEAWFYRTPGLKIVAPSTPHDARALMASAVADPDPVLYYEHIALYRDPRIRQAISDAAPDALPIGKAALRRAGDELAIISYGAYAHVAMRVAEKLERSCAVLDLRSLAPLDREAILAVARHCSRVLIVEEDTRTGSIGESVAAIIQEEAFEFLDAPVRIVGALDTPVPYSPPLEEEFLPSEAQIEKAARLLLRY